MIKIGNSDYEVILVDVDKEHFSLEFTQNGMMMKRRFGKKEDFVDFVTNQRNELEVT